MKKILKYVKIKLRGEVDVKKLQKLGLKIGENFQYGSGCFFDPSHCFLISIGNNVTFSSKIHVLAHDASTKKYTGYTKIGKVFIGDNSFVGANTTILPNIHIGENVIIAAGSVITKSIPSNEVWGGVPAKKICDLDEYLNKYSNKNEFYYFEEDYTFRGKITEKKKIEMINKLQNRIGFVR